MIDHYDWAGGREAMLRFGPDTGPVVVLAMPLFEEANRTRAFMVSIGTTLGEFGLTVALPDLPGQGESLIPTADATLDGWRSAFAACCASFEAPAHVAGLRGGTLVDAEAVVASRWHAVPVAGASLIRDLKRSRLVSASETPERGSHLELAGNLLSPTLIEELEEVESAADRPRRVVREANDRQPADLHVEIPMLWRLNEPNSFPGPARDLALDIVEWVHACGA